MSYQKSTLTSQAQPHLRCRRSNVRPGADAETSTRVALSAWHGTSLVDNAVQVGTGARAVASASEKLIHGSAGCVAQEGTPRPRGIRTFRVASKASAECSPNLGSGCTRPRFPMQQSRG